MPFLCPTLRSRHPVPDDGFTLIEILVAISILAISLVVVLQLFSGGLKSIRVSNDYMQGVFYAQEKMEEILVREALTSGAEEGEFDDSYEWRAEILRMDQLEEEAAKLPFDTFQITVDVTWNRDNENGGKRFQLTTLKVVEKIGAEDTDAAEGEENEPAE